MQTKKQKMNFVTPHRIFIQITKVLTEYKQSTSRIMQL